MFPFKQKKLGGKLIREFSNDINSEDLVWHRDRSDRYVTVLEGKDWYIQFDNKLPIKLVEGQVYYIPAHNYHRVMKGSTNLVLEIKETSEMKITRRQLRKIIKESFRSSYGRRGYRPMVSSGKYQEWTDIQSKYPEFYQKAKVSFRGYNGEFEGLNLQDFVRSLDPQWLASAPLMSPAFRVYNPEEKERAQLEAVLLSIVRPRAAKNIPDISALRKMHGVR